MKNWEKNKKVYSKPELEVVKVDHEISLVMMTNPPSDEDTSGSGDWTSGTSATIEMGASSPVSTFNTTDTNNPFGTSSPNYNN